MVCYGLYSGNILEADYEKLEIFEANKILRLMPRRRLAVLMIAAANYAEIANSQGQQQHVLG